MTCREIRTEMDRVDAAIEVAHDACAKASYPSSMDYLEQQLKLTAEYQRLTRLFWETLEALPKEIQISTLKECNFC